jgi:hypothetical protein
VVENVNPKNHLLKFKMKMEARKIVLQEEIYPAIKNSEPNSKLAKKLIKLDWIESKAADKNEEKKKAKFKFPKFEALKNIEREKFNANKNNKSKKDELFEYNLKLVK